MLIRNAVKVENSLKKKKKRKGSEIGWQFYACTVGGGIHALNWPVVEEEGLPTVEAGSKPEFEFGKGLHGILFILLIKNLVIYSLNSNNADRPNIIV